MSNVRWAVEEHQGPDGLKSIEADWRRLYAEMSHPATWHSYEAYSVYIETLCPAPDTSRCLTLSDGARVRAIMPLEERSEPGFGIPLRVWGVPWHNHWRPTDVIGPEDEARRALLPTAVEHLRRQPGRPAVLVVGPISDCSVLWAGLDASGAGRQFSFNDGAEYVVPTDRPVEEFLSGLGSKSRSQLRKAAKQFEALPDATYVRAAGTDEVAEEFEHFLAVEASGWKGARGTAIQQHPELTAFYRGLTERLTTDGHCEIHSLHAGGRCIAAEFCVYTRGRVDRPRAGYDEAFSNIAPGRLVTHKGLEWSCEDPDVDIVSEGSDAPWLRQWHPVSRGLRRAYVSLRPASGPALVALLRFRYGPLRRAVRAYKARQTQREDRTHSRHGRDAG